MFVVFAKHKKNKSNEKFLNVYFALCISTVWASTTNNRIM